jgi:signal transduction histidine kinase
LQLFSKYWYIWKFNKNQEKEYNQFVKDSNLSSLRLVTFITIFGYSLFLLIDYFKDVDFSIILATRIFVLSSAIAIMWFSYQNISSQTISLFVAFIPFLTFGPALITATYAGMPAYYLTNLLFLIFVLVITASGLHFRYALLVNAILLIVFIVYSNTIRTDSFYFSQYPHVFSIFIYIHIVGIVLESRRRNNFLQFKDLEKQKKLVEDLNEQKNKIISLLSHDVAAPINTLSSVLSLHSKGAFNEDDFKTFIPKLSESFNNVSNLLFSLVRWSRTQLEGFRLHKTSVDITHLIDELINLFQPQLLDKGLEVKRTINKTITVDCDEEMIRIVIRNILSNAIKFARKGTIVTVNLDNYEHKVRICVADMGEPIPQEILNDLFTYNIKPVPDTSGERGTGLGLAMSAFFVQLNGGIIYLSPNDEGLTKFCIELPATENVYQMV